ncbi:MULTISPECIES: hypothetical protein [unclassified Nocardioides]|jgi:hypothetical protein|uniref:LppU/SCO3897 family protein n=1 Tax=unclassified Nocardioides TaxID=2615069 RepID=UPI00070331AF|nr:MULTISPECIES: hypothetical protein [unclassified Nocardioides]KRC51401.1 hypothetical protein ASE19_15040 [Nocardioides sp. Root79]KRC69011.1 hypothetical protein ASE20_15695 [Nocardioides sp. Root240]
MGKSLATRIIGIGVAVVIAVVGGLIWNKGQEKVEEAKAPKVGECVNMTGSSFDADHEELSCDDAKATYKIMSDKGGCDEVELNYTISIGSTDSGNVADLCLDLNAAVGDCFDLGGISTPAKKVACTEATAGSTIAEVASVGKPGDKCANGAQPWENKKRKTLLCMGAAA